MSQIDTSRLKIAYFSCCLAWKFKWADNIGSRQQWQSQRQWTVYTHFIIMSIQWAYLATVSVFSLLLHMLNEKSVCFHFVCLYVVQPHYRHAFLVCCRPKKQIPWMEKIVFMPKSKKMKMKQKQLVDSRWSSIIDVWIIIIIWRNNTWAPSSWDEQWNELCFSVQFYYFACMHNENAGIIWIALA